VVHLAQGCVVLASELTAGGLRAGTGRVVLAAVRQAAHVGLTAGLRQLRVQGIVVVLDQLLLLVLLEDGSLLPLLSEGRVVGLHLVVVQDAVRGRVHLKALLVLLGLLLLSRPEGILSRSVIAVGGPWVRELVVELLGSTSLRHLLLLLKEDLLDFILVLLHEGARVGADARASFLLEDGAAATTAVVLLALLSLSLALVASALRFGSAACSILLLKWPLLLTLGLGNELAFLI